MGKERCETRAPSSVRSAYGGSHTCTRVAGARIESKENNGESELTLELLAGAFRAAHILMVRVVSRGLR